MDRNPVHRYTEVANNKKILISGFIDYLKKESLVYYIAFGTLSALEKIIPDIFFVMYFGEEFYYECLSISKVIKKPVT